MCVTRHEQLRDEPGPARLMRRADAAAGVAMEVFVEQQVIAEMRVLLQARVMREYGPMPVLVREENASEPRGELVGDVIDREERSGSSRTFDAEVAAEVVVKLLQRFDDEEIHRKPDRAAPVRVATEEAAVGLSGLVAHAEIHVVVPINIWVLFVHA